MRSGNTCIPCVKEVKKVRGFAPGWAGISCASSSTFLRAAMKPRMSEP
jgi:hypothetical protein